MSEHIELSEVEGGWTVSVTLKAAAGSAAGSYTLRTDAEPDAESPQHIALGRAAAWLAIGRTVVAEDVAGARDAAEAGIDALGTAYRPPRVKDDTKMKLAAGRERIDAGAEQDGVEVMLDVLEQRMRLYYEAHSDELVPPAG